MPVLAPALMFTAEREKEPDTGKDWVRLPTRLDRPWPISSWFGSILSLVLAAMALAMEIASMKPTSEMTMAADSRLPIMSQENLGRPNEGRPSGILPTTSPPPVSFRLPLRGAWRCASDGHRTARPPAPCPGRRTAPAAPSAPGTCSKTKLRTARLRLAVLVFAILELQLQQLDLVVQRRRIVGLLATRPYAAS